MAPKEEDYDPSLMKQALGVGEIEGTKDKKQYHGTVPFDNKTPVYMIEQEIFHKLIEDGIQLLRNSRIPITPEVVKLFPDEIDFSVIRDDDTPDKIKLYLDRFFYTHDLDNYTYVRFASMQRFLDEEELPNYEAHRHSPKLDTIEDSVVIRDDVLKAKSLEDKIKKDNPGLITPEDVYGGNDMPEKPTKGMWFYDGDEWYEIDDYDDGFDDDIDPDIFWDRGRNNR